jgi:hypothetical protein
MCTIPSISYENEKVVMFLKENETILSISIDGSTTGNPKVEELTESIMKLNAGKIPYDLNGDLVNDSEVELIFLTAN